MKNIIRTICIVIVVSVSTSAFTQNHIKNKQLQKDAVIKSELKIMNNDLDYIRDIYENLVVVGVSDRVYTCRLIKEGITHEVTFDCKKQTQNSDYIVMSGGKLVSKPLDDEVIFITEEGYSFGWSNKGLTEIERIERFKERIKAENKLT